MTKEEKIKRATWRIARKVLESGDWGFRQDVNPASYIPAMVKSAISLLSDSGCFDEQYGETGSLEIDLVAGVIGKYSNSDILDKNEVPTAASIFTLVRELDSAGLLTDEQRKRSRTIAFDREKLEAEKSRAEKERLENEERERLKLIERKEARAAAEKRLEEIARARKENA